MQRGGCAKAHQCCCPPSEVRRWKWFLRTEVVGNPILRFTEPCSRCCVSLTIKRDGQCVSDAGSGFWPLVIQPVLSSSPRHLYRRSARPFLLPESSSSPSSSIFGIQSRILGLRIRSDRVPGGGRCAELSRAMSLGAPTR